MNSNRNACNQNVFYCGGAEFQTALREGVVLHELEVVKLLTEQEWT